MTTAHMPNAYRDQRIDVFRGLALVMIFINHVQGNMIGMFTLRGWGFSDSAEVFVLLAGTASALAYGRYFEHGQLAAGLFAIFSRIWSLYIMHLMLFLVIAGLCVFAAEQLNDATFLELLGFDVFLQAPASFIRHVLTLTFQPAYLDILPLYIVLLTMVPLMFALARRHAMLLLVASLIVWALSQFWPLNLPNTRTAREWFFNPFAWQLLFVIGFTMGRAMGAKTPVISRLSMRFRTIVTVFAVLYCVVAFLVVAPWREWPGLENVFLINPTWMAAFSKTDLHLVRLLDVLAKLWLVLICVDAGQSWLRSMPARIMAAMGRHSLEVFAFSTILAMLGSIFAAHFQYSAGAMSAVNMIGIGLMITLAYAMDWRRSLMAAPLRAIDAAHTHPPLAVERSQ
jgi:hypothetical protein